jgi:hypothetical protein
VSERSAREHQRALDLLDRLGHLNAKPKSISEGALAAGLVGTVGVGAALGVAIFGNSIQPRARDRGAGFH